MSRVRINIAALIWIALNAYQLSAIAAPARDFSTYRPIIEAARIEPSEAPRIDGDISDAVWAKARPIDEFYQVEPKAGEPATERTVIRVLYDRDALYFSIYCYDDDPKHIPLGAKARDTNVQVGDFVRILLDPFMTRRNGYTFEINVLGGRGDALLFNNQNPLHEWNTLWSAKTRRVSDGWTIEVRLPFRSISYDAKRTDWGIDFYRRMYRISERVRWTAADPRIQTFDITHEGSLTGVRDISQGLGLDIQVFSALKYKHDWVRPHTEDDAKLAFSGNLFYKITPSLTGTLTANPDFSNTPLDDRKINTTRFSLFFPETRSFFLQDASAFEFGGLPYSTNDGGDTNGMPYFSRNVGLVHGSPVPIDWGAKVSGQVFGWNVGGFSAIAEGLGGQNNQTLSVVRASHSVLDESKLGFIFTNGDPTGNSNNSVVGGDFQYRNSHILGGNILNIDTSYLHSISSTNGQSEEYILGVAYPNEPWYGRVYYRQIGSRFSPALGFINRSGIRDYITNFGWTKRITDQYFQWFQIGLFDRATTDIGNRLQSYNGSFYVGAQNNSGDQAYVNVQRQYEAVDGDFNVGGRAIVKAGTYRWNYMDFNFVTSAKRPWFLSGDISCCNFYSGKALQIYLQLSYRPNETLEIIPSYTVAYINLPTGAVDIHAPSLSVNVNFTPDMSIQSQAQYDNLSHNMGLSARYRWEYRPGAEFFAAIGESALITNRLSHFASQTSAAAIRIGQTFQF